MPGKPIPDGYATLTPYLCFEGAAQTIEFYKRAFGASERMRMPGATPDEVGHAELEIAGSVIVIADMPAKSPAGLGATSVSFVVYFDDVNSAFQRALDAGARTLQPIEDKFYGDRMGTLAGPWGHEWSLATHIEDVSPEEMEKRATAAAAPMA